MSTNQPCTGAHTCPQSFFPSRKTSHARSHEHVCNNPNTSSSQSPVGVQESKGFPLLQLPEEMQRLILGHIPLRELARMACLSKDLRAAYRDRTRDRDAAVTAVLESHFTAEFRAALTPVQTALPNDLIVVPSVR
jgi:hypothetical protein